VRGEEERKEEGPREEVGQGGKRKEGERVLGWAEREGWAGSFFSLLFPISFLHSNIQTIPLESKIDLNSNPHNKTMQQHECTSKLTYNKF
jgi:hypothetical protein